MKNRLHHSVRIVLLVGYFLAGVVGNLVGADCFPKSLVAIKCQKAGKLPQRTAYWTQHKHIPATTKSVQPLSPHLIFPTQNVVNSTLKDGVIVFVPLRRETISHRLDSRAPPFA